MNEVEFFCDNCDEYFTASEDTKVCPTCGEEVSRTEEE